MDRHATLKRLIPHGQLGGELRAIARDDERAARDQRRLLNRLRADLQTTYPAALTLAGDDLGAPTALRLLERWPTQAELATASRDELVAFARTGKHGWQARFADQVAAALAAPQLPARRSGKTDYVVARRLAHNHYLGAAVHQWAFCSICKSAWAREFYQQKTAAGKSHHAALRALGNRWLEILWHCLRHGVRYDENLHQANRNRALGHAA